MLLSARIIPLLVACNSLLLYSSRNRVLSFLVVLEVLLLTNLVILSISVGGTSIMLVVRFIRILACEASVGLSVLVGQNRYRSLSRLQVGLG